MLKSLLIKNFVLIEKLNIYFDKGFSVITGETGAGKSIILGALGLVLGQRADSKMVLRNQKKCVIEVSFDITGFDLEFFFMSHELDYDETHCLLRRELLASGKSRAFVNDTPVSLTVVRELGDRLIDIHSQHQNLLLGDTQFQLKVVDVMGLNKLLLQDYKQVFANYQKTYKQVQKLKEEIIKRKQDEDYMLFQLKTLSAARLVEGEQEELEKESEALSHAEEIKGGLFKASQLLNNDEGGVVANLREALSIVEGIHSFLDRSEEMEERLRSAYIDLDDLASEMEGLKEDTENNPKRNQIVSERLDVIYNLERKYNVDTIGELLALKEELEKRMENIEELDETLEVYESELVKLKDELELKAQALSDRRKKVAKTVAKELIFLIKPLGMPNVRFEVDVKQKEELGADGKDEVQFLFNANKQGPLQSVSEAASGGEISRLMLCVKSMIAGFIALPTIIFDEIDTGVSGDIADKMGEIMCQLGQKMQVLAITHLPQIAAKGRAHYYVYKVDGKTKTETCIKPLEDEERVTELARMLSGSELTEAAVANAKVLLKQ